MSLSYLTPREIVSELDKYIVGQNEAKRTVAIALRNRWRRQQVPDELRDEIAPKNIIMIGSTGVGKTEIARRLARLAQSPFLKVEVTKFTEVGYVGRDVESMIRDLAELAINMVKAEEKQKVSAKAEEVAEERLLDLLLPPPSGTIRNDETQEKKAPEGPAAQAAESSSTREKIRKLLRDGKLAERFVDLEVTHRAIPSIEIFSSAGMEEMDLNLKDMFGNLFPKKTRLRKVKVPEAYQILVQEESQRLIDMDKVVEEAVRKVEQTGIIFLDEIDKIAGRGSSHGPDVSREGVQRDLLPIVEGSTVTTKHGMVRTDHILFIASGAFHNAKPADLIPELQGRFPIRVELQTLTQEDFIRILTEPQSALTSQYRELMKTEGLQLRFTEEAVSEIARMAFSVNQRTENIGARRLHTVMEKLLQDLSFEAPDLPGGEVVVDGDYVRGKLSAIEKDEDLSRYIL